ncbi:MAG: hypothetical protein RMJ59_06615 [Candidatus Nitrosocaldus sp.]|nr:hypothetical protein [Candidatus Nitrosocaldus sp.]MDW8276032.1 hypothetical protein [Candidatus Nitrosocaldus sp.]
MNLSEANVVLRKAVVSVYFEPELMKRNYRRSSVKHPNIEGEGITMNDHLHLFFDLQTGCDYPDGDEWFIVEYVLPYNIRLPDNLKGPDYFTTLAVDEGNSYWRHRELVRYRYGKSKRLDEAVDFIDRKYRELSDMLNEHSLIGKGNSN